MFSKEVLTLTAGLNVNCAFVKRFLTAGDKQQRGVVQSALWDLIPLEHTGPLWLLLVHEIWPAQGRFTDPSCRLLGVSAVCRDVGNLWVCCVM